jgi:nucleoside-diphosphate-sugar epimerase
MTSDRTILITGVTGNQGATVTNALQGTGFHLRGLTRKPDSERAAALARHSPANSTGEEEIRDRAHDIYLQHGTQPGYPSSRSEGNT